MRVLIFLLNSRSDDQPGRKSLIVWSAEDDSSCTALQVDGMAWMVLYILMTQRALGLEGLLLIHTMTGQKNQAVELFPRVSRSCESSNVTQKREK